MHINQTLDVQKLLNKAMIDGSAIAFKKPGGATYSILYEKNILFLISSKSGEVTKEKLRNKPNDEVIGRFENLLNICWDLEL